MVVCLIVAACITATVAVGNALKDMVSWVLDQKEDINELETRIIGLIAAVSSMRSQKGKIDRYLGNAALTEESRAYAAKAEEIKAITKRCVKFINKYAKSRTNQLTSTTELDASTEALMIRELTDIKTKVVTMKLLQLAKLSRDVEKLSSLASKAGQELNLQNMTQEMSEPVEDMLGGGGGYILPVFDMYADEVLEHLKGAHTVGVLGRKGVGKTTVYEKVHDRVLEQKGQWRDIIRINYPADTETDQGVMALQSEILGQLRISDYPNATKNIDMDAKIISSYLSERKYILLMDDVSTPINLKRIGIRENHGQRKVVIFSREDEVISNMAEEVVVIKGLEYDEARELFQKIYGELLHDEYKLTSVDIIRDYCGGTAGMIYIIADYLKGKDEDSWSNVKEILQGKSDLELLDLAGYDKVYDMTYKTLTIVFRNCLLYGALFPHRCQVYAGYLIECWIAEGLIAVKGNQKVRKNREHGQGLVRYLTKRHMLEWYTSENKVMMSPDFRRVAFKKGYTKDFWVPSRDLSPDAADWQTVTRMSLIGCQVELPQAPECPNMCTLLLQSLEPRLESIHDGFFSDTMRNLKVLDLSGGEMRELPGTINELVSLKSLYLKGCTNLIALPPPAELPPKADEHKKINEIEFLDISGTSISRLPQEIKSMVNMRCLRASLSANRDPKGKQVVDSDDQPVIPPGIISSLRNLEELGEQVEGSSPKGKQVVDSDDQPVIPPGIISSLRNLEELGEQVEGSSPKGKQVVDSDDQPVIPPGIISSLRNLEELGEQVEGSSPKGKQVVDSDDQPVIPPGIISSLRNLEELGEQVEGSSPKGKQVVDSDDQPVIPPGIISSLRNLEELGEQVEGSSPKGKQVVDSDDQPVIPPGIISSLRNLEELSIYTAPGSPLGDADAKRLAMELAGLKHLNTLCFNFPNVSSLDTFVIRSEALKNKRTSLGEQTFRSFKIFIGSHESQHTGEPDSSRIIAERRLRYSTNEEFSEHCQQLLNEAHTFEIIGHDGPQSFTGSQFNLHPVKVCVVERCKNLKNVVDGDRINMEDQRSLLNNLEKLYLYDLESLESIWTGRVPTSSLDNLKAITIDGCHKLTKILPTALARSLQRLQYLKVDNCDNISVIIQAEGGEASSSDKVELLQSLKEIELSNLSSLGSLCGNASISISCNSLKSITVLRCSRLSNLQSLALRNNATKLPLIRCEANWWQQHRETLSPFFHFEDEIPQTRGEEASTSRRGSEISEHRTLSSTTSLSNSGRGSTDQTALSNGASTSNMNLAQSRGEASTSGTLRNATSLSNISGAPSSRQSSITGGPELSPDRGRKGCFPTWGCS